MDSKHIQFYHRSQQVGFRKAFADVYGSDDESPREWAFRLRELGLSYEQISACVKLRFGTGCRNTIRRWVTPGEAEKHNAYRRERFRNARKYARNLQTRGFPMDEIQRRVGGKYSELAQWIKGWILRE